MQKGKVYRNNIFVGMISNDEQNGYLFQYDKEYLRSKNPKAISINLKLQKEPFVSKYLFAFFANMLAEGDIKGLQCKQLRIDKDDDFSRLLKTTTNNTIGSITIEEVGIL
jgi:serine/threonine-protein kinase HipA